MSKIDKQEQGQASVSNYLFAKKVLKEGPERPLAMTPEAYVMAVYDGFKNSNLLNQQLTSEQMDNLKIFWEQLPDFHFVGLFSALVPKDTDYRNLKLLYGKNMPTSKKPPGVAIADIINKYEEGVVMKALENL